jgi:pimeloyl-ACP methyl ester carboxylesterase
MEIAMAVLDGLWQHESMISNGVKLHYVTQGEGPLMLMLHGFPEFWYSWRHQIPEFAKDYKVVAPDLRGYNESEKPPQQSAYVMSEFVKDIEGIIQGLGYDRCVLVGHDWGGAIAWNFADTHPAMLERLIVLNIPHPVKFMEGLRTPQQLMRSWYAFLFQLPVLPELIIELSDYQPIELGLKGLAIDESIFTPADLKAYKDAASQPGALTAMINYYRNPFSNMRQREWDLIQVPTLMIWGEKDKALGKELTYGTEEYVRDLQIRYIPNCGHWLHHEQPELVNRYMREFLAS